MDAGVRTFVARSSPSVAHMGGKYYLEIMLPGSLVGC